MDSQPWVVPAANHGTLYVPSPYATPTLNPTSSFNTELICRDAQIFALQQRIAAQDQEIRLLRGRRETSFGTECGGMSSGAMEGGNMGSDEMGGDGMAFGSGAGRGFGRVTFGGSTVAATREMSSMGHGVSGFSGYSVPGQSASLMTGVGAGGGVRGGDYSNWQPGSSSQMEQMEARFKLQCANLETRVRDVESAAQELENERQDMVMDACDTKLLFRGWSDDIVKLQREVWQLEGEDVRLDGEIERVKRMITEDKKS